MASMKKTSNFVSVSVSFLFLSLSCVESRQSFIDFFAVVWMIDLAWVYECAGTVAAAVIVFVVGVCLCLCLCGVCVRERLVYCVTCILDTMLWVGEGIKSQQMCKYNLFLCVCVRACVGFPLFYKSRFVFFSTLRIYSHCFVLQHKMSPSFIESERN